MSHPFIPNHYPMKELVLSYSSEETYHTCEKKLEFLKFYNYPRLDADTTVAAEVGKVLHVGYQTWLRSRSWEQAMVAAALKFPIDLNPEATDGRSLEATIKTLRAMVDSPKLLAHDLIDVLCDDGQERPALEVPFLLRIKNFFLDDVHNLIPVYYTGFIDGIVYDVVENTYLIIDVKTHRQFNMKNQDWGPLYANQTQCLPYAFVLSHILGQTDTILTKGLKVVYIAVFVDFKEPIIRVHTFDKTPEDIRDWAKGFWKMLSDIRLSYKTQWFQKRGSSCVNYGRTCFAYNLCYGVTNKDFVKLSIEMMDVSEKKLWKRPDPWFTIDLDLQAAIGETV